MSTGDAALLTVAIFLTALLYSSVGHAGATGYLAAMALVGVSPVVMKPTALALNLLVASIAAVRFYRAGCFSWRAFQPLAVASVPCALLGGALPLPHSLYHPVVGIVLLLSALFVVRVKEADVPVSRQSIPRFPALLAGAGIGLLAGLTGVGGGVFLSPLLLVTHWVSTREAAGLSAAFNLFNSAAGFAGTLTRIPSLPSALPLWLVVAGIGSFMGAGLGSQQLAPQTLRYLLSTVLVVAGLKMLLGR